MENKIKKKQKLAKDTYLIELHCPAIAQKAQPGNFIMVRVSENGERIPLTIADFSRSSISIVFKEVGYTTKMLSNMRSGNSILDIAGPLGQPSDLGTGGNICFVGGGAGVAALYPLIKSMRKKGNNLITIVGARSKSHLFWLDRLSRESNRVLISTDDGSMGRHGQVTDILKVIMRRRLDVVYTAGPLPMMMNVAKMTWRMVKTKASLNPIMVDGIGMCGGCRVKVDEKVRFCCTDGPEFDAHKVDWDELIIRNSRYLDAEKKAVKACSCGAR